MINETPQAESHEAIEPTLVKIQQAGPVLMVSLFLLLLSFFILLNSLSVISETKSKSVVASVSTTFQRTITERLTGNILVSNVGDITGIKASLENLETLWSTEMPIARIDRLTEGTGIEVRIPSSELFVGGSTKLRSDRERFFKILAESLSSSLENLDAKAFFIAPIDDTGTIDLRQIAPPTREESKKLREEIALRQEANKDVYDPANFSDFKVENESIEDAYYSSGRTLGAGRVITLVRYLNNQGVDSARLKPSLRQAEDADFIFRFMIDTPEMVSFTPNSDTEFLATARSRSGIQN